MPPRSLKFCANGLSRSKFRLPSDPRCPKTTLPLGFVSSESGGMLSVSQVTNCLVPTGHTLSLLGLVIWGETTVRRLSGEAWTKESKNEMHRSVKANIVKVV